MSEGEGETAVTDQASVAVLDAVRPAILHREMKYITYRCSNPKCKAEDQGKFFPEERIPPVINCHSCKAGLQMPLDQMLKVGVGMFPVIEASPAPFPRPA